MIDLHAGDPILSRSFSPLDEIIEAGQSGIAPSIPKWVHALIALEPAGTILDTVWPKIKIGHIDDYIGCSLLIGRYQEAAPADVRRACEAVKKDVGRRYPPLRLVLDGLGVGRLIHGRATVCSEEQAKFLWHLTGFDEFENWAGWEPGELAVVYRRWREFEVIFEGTWKGLRAGGARGGG